MPAAATLLVVFASIAAAPAPAGPLNAALDAARGKLRLRQPQAALDELKKASLHDVVPDNPAQWGVLGLAASGAGDAALAERAFAMLLDKAHLPPLARAMVQLRRLEVCTTGCGETPVDEMGALGLPQQAQARLLGALAKVAAQRAGSLGEALVKHAPWTAEMVHPSERAELLMALHEALAAAGKADLARDVTEVAWEQLPGEPSLAPLIRKLTDARLTARLGPERGLNHLQSLLVANRNDDVIEFGGLLCQGDVVKDGQLCAVLPRPQACLVGFSVGKAQRQSRQYADAENTLGVVAAQCPDFAARALYLQGKAMLGQVGGGPRAIGTFDALARQHPANRLADDALLLAGQIALRHRRGSDARGYLQRVLTDHPGGDQFAEASWWLAWDQRSRGKAKTAREKLDQMCHTLRDRDVPTWRRALYWRARLNPDPAGAADEMRLVTTLQPYSWEAGLARGWLARSNAALPVVPSLSGGPERVAPPAELDEHARAAIALAAVGLDEDAAAMLRVSKLMAGWKAGGPGSDLDLFVAQQLIDVGDAATASRWVRTRHAATLRETPDEKNALVWRLAYPRAHHAAIEAAADEARIPRALLFALAREESAFDARVTSWAGAIGLTQLMPATANAEARALGMRSPDVEALLDPALNARLGAAHLKRHLREFNGSVPLALAAYNAGPGAVRSWLKRARDVELDAFVEQIPIEETRGYVKRVTESYQLYLVLSGEAPLALPKGPTDPVIAM